MINPFKQIAQIGLDYVLPNPYQPREHEDARHVARVAESILTQGLLQPPVGRYTDIRRVELAFGHTRLAAFKLLTQIGLQGMSDTLGAPEGAGLDLTEFPALAGLLAQRISGEIEACEDWLYLPVNVRELSDEEMFKMGISENLARKDLTPIEEARAMARYRDEFGKTSREIGELFGLSGEAVRGKIRLLELPEGEIKDAFAAGRLSEGAAREVLSLLALPERMRDDAERGWYVEHKPSAIIHDAAQGALASSIHARVEHIIQANSDDLSRAPWKHDEIISAADSGLAEDMPVCTGCPNRVQRGNKFICLDKTCYWRKHKAWEQRYVRRAAAAVGIPALEAGLDSTTNFYGRGGTADQALQTAKSARCPNLRVEYGGFGGIANLEPEGFKEAQLVCKKRRGFCTCQKAVEAGVELSRQPTVDLVAKASGGLEETAQAEQAPITLDELSAVAKEARRQKKAAMDQCQALLLLAADSISQGLQGANPGAVRLVLEHMSYQYKDKNLTDAEARLVIGKFVAAGIHNPDGYYNSPDPAQSLAAYNQVLQKSGLNTIGVEILEPGDDHD